jgi:[acyl-carrier-protein] S-malonyltransferase
MTKVTLIFPGQGSQYVGMGNHPLLSSYFTQANTALDYNLQDICFSGPEDKIKLTQNTQPSIVTHSYAHFQNLLPFLTEKGVEIERVLGHSVGEYSALCAAGVISFEDAVRSVHLRGKYMQEAVAVGEGKMYAILRAPQELVETVCKEASSDAEQVTPANFNEPSQIVISGHAAACDRASEIFAKNEEFRIKCVELPVSAPFHCSLMKPAEEQLESFLQTVKFNRLNHPYIANINAQEYPLDTQTEVIKQNLIEQVCGSVQWTQSLINLDPKTKFIEVGPGRILKGLLRKINKEFKVLSLDSIFSEDEVDWEKLENFLEC